METYVLVPGAWHGAWAWRPVAQRLRARGHRVFALTLPGLADGVALLDDVPPGHAAPFRQLARESADHSVVLPYPVWQEAFAQETPEPARRLLYDLLVPQPMSYFEQPKRS